MVKKRTKNNFFSKRRYSRKKYPKRKSKRRKSRKRYKRRYSRKNKQKGGGTYWFIVLYNLPRDTIKGDNFRINYKITKNDGSEIDGSGHHIADQDYPDGIRLSSPNKFTHSKLRNVGEDEAEEIPGTVTKLDNTSVDATRSKTPERTERSGGARAGTPPR
tara:strand:- start:1225 stop:1704 length:480 start_codon:yes stop_codon:yes gene_type:complete